ncbi:hypothetical protein BpHYR1_042941 [Brachionus plicatilis]|uniref:Uncharacterized protein n=1 Tax=Brachionus plicatilis TaxID=10195 RepID=A0A3M7PVB0_BRAPC|nr:hypothetical protein BpHYR1_042941 [Brachionus plicatilis]
MLKTYHFEIIINQEHIFSNKLKLSFNKIRHSIYFREFFLGLPLPVTLNNHLFLSLSTDAQR